MKCDECKTTEDICITTDIGTFCKKCVKKLKEKLLKENLSEVQRAIIENVCN